MPPSPGMAMMRFRCGECRGAAWVGWRVNSNAWLSRVDAKPDVVEGGVSSLLMRPTGMLSTELTCWTGTLVALSLV